MRRAWMAPDGEARVQVLPKGDPDDTEVLRHFVTAVLAVEPGATGPAVMLYEAGNTILRAFIEAGAFAILSIFVLLWITLRRLGDVAVTLVPLLLAAVLTLELSVVLGMPLNFANVIALPLLLGVGVAFKIYYVTAWRRGMTGLVQSTLTRAVMFSALTTATAFGSLSLSSHPGTSSMGQMMMLALFCTMSAAVLFQPALMGPPRKIAAEEGPSRGVAVFAEEDEDEFEPVRPGARACAAGRGASTRRRNGIPMKSAAEHMPDPAGNLTGYSYATGRAMPRASVGIDNLRAVVIVMVLAFHAMSAYIAFIPQHPFALDAPPFLWRAFPIVDQQRLFGFDLFCGWLDVFLMSFFYLSVGAVRLVEPVAQGAGRLSAGPAAAPGTAVRGGGHAADAADAVPELCAEHRRYDDRRVLAGMARLPLWPSGPAWFLWLLILWDVLAAGVYLLVRRHGDLVLRLSFYARQRPAIFLGALLLGSALAYIPLALLFGPANWFQAGPFGFQLSRPLHYVLYFFAGAVIGACGIERGLFAPDGPVLDGRPPPRGLRGRGVRALRHQRALPPHRLAAAGAHVDAAPGPLDDLRLHRRDLHAGRAARVPRHAVDGDPHRRVGRRPGRRDPQARRGSTRRSGSPPCLCRARVGRHGTAPQLWGAIGPLGSLGIAAGGLLYTSAPWSTRPRPARPGPRVFGYHEVFHAFVIVAAALHYAVICFAILPGSA